MLNLTYLIKDYRGLRACLNLIFNVNKLSQEREIISIKGKSKNKLRVSKSNIRFYRQVTLTKCHFRIWEH